MASIQEGDTEALRLFYRRHRHLFRSMIVRTVNDDATVDDVLQDCLVELWRRAKSYDPGKGKPLAWMNTLCRRRAIDAVRRKLAYCHAKERMENAMPKCAYDEKNLSENEHADMGHVLEHHLALLPHPQRQAVCLAFINGMSQREIATALHSPLGTVKTRLELGLKKLRHALSSKSAIHTLRAA